MRLLTPLLAASIVGLSLPATASPTWKEYRPFTNQQTEGTLPSAATPEWNAPNGEIPFTLDRSAKTLLITYQRGTKPLSIYEIDAPQWSSQPRTDGEPSHGNTVVFRLRSLDLAPNAEQTLSMIIHDGARRYRLEFAPGKVGINETTTGVAWHDLPDTETAYTYTVTFTPDADLISIYLNDDTRPFATGRRSSNDRDLNKLAFGIVTGSKTGGQTELEFLRWTNEGMFPPGAQ